MDAAAASPPSQELPTKEKPKRSACGDQPDTGLAAPDIGGEAGDEFLFSDDTFPSLPDFPCLSSPSSSTFSSSSSSCNSSCAFPSAADGAAAAEEAAAAAGADAVAPASGVGEVVDGFDTLGDIDLLDFSFSVPWDAEPLFPDVSMMIEDAISAVPPPQPSDGGGAPLGGGDDVNSSGSMKVAGAATEDEEICMAGDDLPKFFMEWLTSNKDNISAEDLRSIRLRRSTIEAAAARLGGGQHGTLQLLKLILTWVQNHHLQRKRRRAVMAHGHGHLQSPNPLPSFPLSNGVTSPNPSFEFGAGGQDSSSLWMPYPADGAAYSAFAPPPPPYGSEAMYPGGATPPYAFHPSCSTSSVVVNSQPFSPQADMHAVNGANISWPQQYAPFPGATTPYTVPVVPPPYAGGFPGQYLGSHPLCHQRVTGMAPSATKEARKKRMARQRRLSCLHQHRNQLGQTQSSNHPADTSPQTAHSSPGTPSQGGCRNWGFWPSMGPQHSQHQANVTSEGVLPAQVKSNSARAKQQMPPPVTKSETAAQQESNSQRSAGSASEKRQGPKADKNLRFLLQKVLKQSDVGSLGRIVLPKKEAEIHLPELETRDGISIPMEDIGTSRVWNMRYRFWPNNKSRMYLLENTGDFVRSNGLQEGDFIVIYSDVKSGKYMIRGVKVRPTPELSKTASSGGKPQHKHSHPEKVAASDANTNDGGCGGGGGNKGKADIGKGKSPHSMRRAREVDASMNQMAVSI